VSCKQRSDDSRGIGQCLVLTSARDAHHRGCRPNTLARAGVIARAQAAQKRRRAQESQSDGACREASCTHCSNTWSVLKCLVLPPIPPLSTLTACAALARPLHPAALASVPSGNVLVRVRVRSTTSAGTQEALITGAAVRLPSPTLSSLAGNDTSDMRRTCCCASAGI
jgi:hypothetical protein